uniref:AB hydrolase-1 domain-containing protein n=1 Tax=Megaselia scalaris TaxID=36166 RepID=T1GXH1_MEGSC
MEPKYMMFFMISNLSMASDTFLLADAGYDVWLANTRGNSYSRAHNTLTMENEDFWEFSFHEIGFYDLPALIDFIRKETAFHQLMFIGHSQGATAFLVMCSMKPEYNERVILFQALAPLYIFKHAKFTKNDVMKVRKFVRET